MNLIAEPLLEISPWSDENFTLFEAREGAKVSKNDLIAEVMPQKNRSTEKVTKDVSTDLSGEVHFADIAPETVLSKIWGQ